VGCMCAAAAAMVRVLTRLSGVDTADLPCVSNCAWCWCCGCGCASAAARCRAV
jgi:hypothetical protein